MHNAEMNMRFEHGPFGKIAVYTVSANFDVVLHALDVLQNHVIPSILPVYYREQLGLKQLCIDCTGYVPLSDAPNMPWSGILQKKTETAHFLRAILDAEDHFLGLDSFNIDPDYVFLDTINMKLAWCCLPVNKNTVRETVASERHSYEKLELLLMDPFFGDVLEENDRNQVICLLRDGREDDFIQFLDYYVSGENDNPPTSNKKRITSSLLSIQIILMLSILLTIPFLRKLNHGLWFIDAWSSWYVIGFSIFLAINITLLRGEKSNHKNTEISNRFVTFLLSQKEILFPDCESEINDKNREIKECVSSPAFLTYTSEHTSKVDVQKRAVIWVDDFLIGRDRCLCDLYLDHPSISDRHARILHRNPLYFLMDVGSNEGTFIGHRRLYSYEESPLKDGDVITCGKVQYLFSQKSIDVICS